MKKSTKTLLMASFAMLIVGAAFGIVSFCFGFEVEAFREAVDEGKFQVIGPSGWSGDVKDWVSDLTTENVEFSESYTGIDSLDLEIGTAECMIIPYSGKEWKVSGYNLPSRFTCKKSGKTLKIDSSKSGFRFFNFGGDNAVLELYIPKTQCADKIKINAGVGSVGTVDGILVCDELDLDCGVGECVIRADIRKKGEIEGGVGSISLTLVGEEQDYNYDIDCGVGSIDIEDNHYSELGNKKKIDNGADRDLEIDCGVGSVEIYFEEE